MCAYVRIYYVRLHDLVHFNRYSNETFPFDTTREREKERAERNVFHQRREAELKEKPGIPTSLQSATCVCVCVCVRERKACDNFVSVSENTHVHKSIKTLVDNKYVIL